MRRGGELVLELTGRCPLSCLHCSSCSGPASRAALGRDVAAALIHQARGSGFEKISFGGGEPTVSADLLGVLQVVRDEGLAAEIFTCGVAESGGRLRPLPDRLVQALAAMPHLRVIFSLHGASQRDHEAVAQASGSFDCLAASVRGCVEAGIRCEANFVPLRLNVHSFPGVIGLCERMGLHRLSVLRFVPQGRGAVNRQELELSPEEEREFVRALSQARKDSRVDVRTGSPYNGIVPGNAVPCRAGANKLVVQPDGNVLPCEVFKHNARRSWGLSVYGLSLSGILASPQVVALRRALLSAGCLECPVHCAPARIRCGEREGDHAREASAVLVG